MCCFFDYTEAFDEVMLEELINILRELQFDSKKKICSKLLLGTSSCGSLRV